MLIIIHGEDAFRSREWLRELIAKFREKFDPDGYNIARIVEPENVAALNDAICAPPFFGSKRLVIIEHFFEISKQTHELEKIMRRIPESTIVICWESAEDKQLEKHKLFQTLAVQKETKTYAFPLLTAKAFHQWLKTHAAKQGVSFNRGGFEFFCVRVGVNTWSAHTELQKLAALAQPVSVRDIEDQVQSTAEGTVFQFVDAVAARDGKRACAELRRERLEGAAPAQLVAMIARQVRILFSAKDYLKHHPGATSTELAEVFRWHPFVAKKTSVQIRAFQTNTLRKLSRVIFESDRDLKTGLLDPETSVEKLTALMVLK